MAYTRCDHRRDDRRDNRPVYTLQAIVAATNTSLIDQPTGDCRGNDRRDDRSDRLRRPSPLVYALLGTTLPRPSSNTAVFISLICVVKENKDLQKAAETEWVAIYGELQRLLRRGVTACLRDRVSLPPQVAEKYFISGKSLTCGYL